MVPRASALQRGPLATALLSWPETGPGRCCSLRKLSPTSEERKIGERAEAERERSQPGHSGLRSLGSRFSVPLFLRVAEECCVEGPGWETPVQPPPFPHPGKINHFPGMTEICRKDLLARNLNRMQKLYPTEYNIFPRTWCLPADYGDFQSYGRQRKTRTFICKPDSGSQGRGIFITRSPREVKPGEHMICQQYISKPFLIDGFKFDMRIYVLITSCDPLRIFMYEEGLARFATRPYVEPTNNNLEDVCMHLTNYAINKRNENFVRDDSMGSKRKLSTLNAWLQEHSHDPRELWEDIEDIIIKTVISAHPVLRHNYRTCFPQYLSAGICACFEILGFDVLLDHKMKPWLLEVNHSPSFTTDSRLDREVKDALLCDSMTLVNLRGCDKRKVLEEDKRRVKERLLQYHLPLRENRQEQRESSQAAMRDQERYEDSHLGGYRRIYPGPDSEKYKPFFKHNGSLFQETAASKAREECARQQLEEIRQKQEQKENSGTRKRKDKDQNLGESVGEKSRCGARPQGLCTHLAHRNRHQEKEQLQVLDTMKPQEIVEEEELERMKCMLQRENLIRSLGIVEQLHRMLHPNHHRGQKNLPEYRPRHDEDGLGGQELQPLNLVPLVLLRGAVSEQGPPHVGQPLQPQVLTPRVLGPLSSMNAATTQRLKPKNFNWTGDPAATGSCSSSNKSFRRHYFSSARVRLTSQSQASRRLEAINRNLAGSVPPTLTPKQGYVLQRDKEDGPVWSEGAAPSGKPAPSSYRYLHEEFAESWSVPRLAEGFDVSTDVIRRVLKSKFVPTLKQKLKQDQKVLKKAGLALPAWQRPSSGHSLPPCSAGSLLIPGDEASATSQSHHTALEMIASGAHSKDSPRRQKGGSQGVQGLRKESEVPCTTASGHRRELPKCPRSDPEDATPDGSRLPNRDRMQELKAGEPDGQNFSPKVVQRGQEFYDSNGNFLYRI
ncbi:PREDICTED: tubulin polyglutamylase TTLL13-like [Dipodomys ordii]|uniref:Tubulin polyglutamylase TTLL13-like n=1 Tax=Dipodomys ordii TaxID=10020 RepID=A0A1S3ETR7_DIPOR|nr:PREDICTED: tubulin polyglutamylase TTLL13-like [Dipodomys ordii]